MATIVRHKETKAHYLLLGAGLAAYKSTRPSALFGNLAPIEESDEIRAVLLAAMDGSMLWIKSEFLEVVSVDGQSPKDILAAMPNSARQATSAPEGARG